MDNQWAMLLFQATIFMNMFAVGVNQSWDDLTSLWRDPAKLLRSLLAVVVLVPAFVFAMLSVIDMPIALATGLAILAASPGAPMTYKRSKMAAASTRYVGSLQLTVGALSIVLTPLTLALFYGSFELVTEAVSIRQVGQQVAIVQFLPITLSVLISRLAPELAAKAAKPVTKIADILFIVLVLVVLVPALRFLAQAFGGGAIAASGVLAIVAVAIGHLLGGPDRSERSGLAVATVARNIGLALLIAAMAGSQDVVLVIVVFAVVGFLIAAPYSVMVAKGAKDSSG